MHGENRCETICASLHNVIADNHLVWPPFWATFIFLYSKYLNFYFKRRYSLLSFTTFQIVSQFDIHSLTGTRNVFKSSNDFWFLHRRLMHSQKVKVNLGVTSETKFFIFVAEHIFIYKIKFIKDVNIYVSILLLFHSQLVYWIFNLNNFNYVFVFILYDLP